MAQIKIISSLEIKKDRTFDSEYFVKKEKIISKYNKFFQNKTSKKFLEVVNIKYPKEIKQDDLVFHNKGVRFFLEVSKEDKENKGRHIVFEIKDTSFSKQCILRFFLQKEIQNYLSLFTKGNIITFLPRTAFNELKVISPTKINQNLDSVNIFVNSEFKEIIKVYFNEYQKNLEQGNYLSASFLVGSISEAILHQFLLDKGVKKKFLKNKMFGQLLEIIGIMNLEIMNLEDFKKIKKFRNLIHPNNALKNIDKMHDWEKEIEPTFNRIIKNFGI